MNLKPVSLSTKPPFKRRRLLGSTTPSVSPTTAPPKVLSITTGVKGISPICTSCHRAFNLAPGVAGIIQCAVCLSTTCTVCSRTCTHGVASHPPTPSLTWSPTPSPPLMPSPRRSVLALNSPNTNTSLRPADQLQLTPAPLSVPGKRRKTVDEDGDEPDLCHLRDLKGVLTGEGGIDEQEQDRPQDELGLGCGRLVCRRCCYEDIPANTTTCVECYGSRTNHSQGN